MKLVSFHRENLTPGVGVARLAEPGAVLDLNAADPHFPQNVNGVLAGGESWRP